MSAAFAILWRGGVVDGCSVRIGTSELQFVCAMDGLAMVAPCGVVVVVAVYSGG